MKNVNSADNPIHRCRCNRCKPSNITWEQWLADPKKYGCFATFSELKHKQSEFPGIWYCDKPIYKRVEEDA